METEQYIAMFYHYNIATIFNALTKLTFIGTPFLKLSHEARELD